MNIPGERTDADWDMHSMSARYPEKCFNVGALVRWLGNFVHQNGVAARTRGFIRRGPGSPHSIEVLVSPVQLPVLESKTNQTKPQY
ncbi:hypothetical protein [Bradyrhizobium sp. Arg816]|uniref:hypothetical protein n=1 Tax=Bradyrhizobium sp. Arg816 TaxID=2998491 RepID=UPI00249DAF7C|nr:hypothetical protein [Bradyrhizobium sp. Arg816]MDI3567480.1 hypothetical protein [Bradyrhizobium sp. Arg816]